MAFPKSVDEARAQGYKFDNGANCRGCGQLIEWWISPRLRPIPLDVDDRGNITPHHATCPKAAQFRGKK